MQQLTKRAKVLRKNLTDAEQYLWYILQRKNFKGLKFRRQQPIGKYIVDFVCFSKKLIIELDGGQHAEEQREYDKKRDSWLKGQGFIVLRFWNTDVLENREGVITEILKHCAHARIPPPLTPPTRGGEKREGE